MTQLIITLLILLIVVVYAGIRIFRLVRPKTRDQRPSACASCSSDCGSCSLLADLSQKK